MPARRTVSVRQMELLLEFAESHRDIALGRSPGGPQAIQATRQLWESVTLRLNSIADGSTRTAEQWRRYWIEYKAKTKCKAADSRRNGSATGGRHNKLFPLTEHERRVLALIDPVTVEGLSGVRLPINIPSADSAVLADLPGASSSIAIPLSSADTIIYEVKVKEEWLEEDPLTIGLHPESQTFKPPPSDETQPVPTGDVVDYPEVPCSEDRQAPRSTASARRSRSQRYFPAKQRALRWAYDIEKRRVAAEERHAAALEGLLDVMREILTTLRDDRHGSSK